MNWVADALLADELGLMGWIYDQLRRSGLSHWMATLECELIALAWEAA